MSILIPTVDRVLRSNAYDVVRHKARGYFDPGRLDTVTHLSAATTLWSGGTDPSATFRGTSKHFRTASNNAFNVTNKFSISFWFQPLSGAMLNGNVYLLGRADEAVSGWYVVYTTTGGAGGNKHHLDFYLAGQFRMRIDASELPVVGGHIAIFYDSVNYSGGPASNRCRMFVNRQPFSMAEGNVSFVLTPPDTVNAHNYPLTVGALGGNYTTPGRCSGAFRDFGFWNQDVSSYIDALYNDGVPPGYDALPSDLKDSSLIDFWEFTGTNTGNESSVTYASSTGSGRSMACLFCGTSGTTAGSSTATPSRAFATRIRNPYALGDSFYSSFGSAPEFLHPSLWTGGSSDLFSKAALRSWGLNHWNVATAQTMRFDGDLDRIGNNASGDMLMVNYIRDRGTAENFYMSFQNNGTPFGATKYFICGYFDAANSYRPTYRIANPPVFNSNVTYSDASLNVATGDKHLVHYFRDPGGVLRYQRTVLATGVMTEGTHPGGAVPDCWTNYGGEVTHIFLGGHERSMSLRGDIGRFAVTTGLSSASRAVMRNAMLTGYA